MFKRILTGATVLTLMATSMCAAPANAGSSSAKQIVFMLGDRSLRFTNVSISGYNQNGRWVTWNQQDHTGFYVAYTKNWWWREDLVRISFTISNGRQSRQGSCSIDVLAQPPNRPTVEIVYYPDRGCVGGEAGSARDPIAERVKPIQDAFATLWYYLPDDKFDFFIRLMYYEANGVSCVLGVAAVVKTGGVAALGLAALDKRIADHCSNMGKQVVQLLTGK
jgi:hypothetical protein